MPRVSAMLGLYRSLKELLFNLSSCAILFVLSVLSNKAYSQQCEVVKIAGSTSWYPYAYVDENRNRRGIGFDVVESILQEMEQEYEVSLFIPWKRIQQNLTQGQLDILVSNHWTKEREQKWNLTEEIGREDLLVHTLNKNSFEVVNWLSLHGKAGVVARGTALGEEYEKHKKHLSLTETGRHERGFSMLNKEFVDYMLLTRSAAAPFLKKQVYSDVVQSDTVLNSYSITISFSKSSPCSHLYAKFNKLLKQRIAKGWLDKIKHDYTNLQPQIFRTNK